MNILPVTACADPAAQNVGLPDASCAPSIAFASAQEVLTFQIGEVEYGIPLSCVQEIRSYQLPTRLAGASSELLGVIDLRGAVVPLLDLRRRFALDQALFDSCTVIIVVQVDGRPIGAVADQVNEVLNLAPDQIHAMPQMPAAGLAQSHLRGLASVSDRRLLLLDIESLLRGCVIAH